MFVEVGSSEREWEDPDAARAVARALLDLRGVDPDAPPENGTRRHLVGVGGGHYAPRFERVVRETDWAVGHVLADWGLDALGEFDGEAARGVFEQALTESRADYALVDGDRPGAAAAVARAGGRVVSETWVRETAGVPLGFVERVEERVAAVADGLRFGARAEGYDGEFRVVPLPEELLSAARGIDGEATRAAVESETLAFETDQSGTRVTGPAVLSAGADPERVIEGLLDVLGQRYDEVTREGEAVLARERAFDPDLAREQGVPEGPKFGKLANGQPVTVEGREISPDDVRSERERRFRVQIP
jgi:D-aminoacyl-tRNA deacylase